MAYVRRDYHPARLPERAQKGLTLTKMVSLEAWPQGADSYQSGLTESKVLSLAARLGTPTPRWGQSPQNWGNSP